MRTLDNTLLTERPSLLETLVFWDIDNLLLLFIAVVLTWTVDEKRYVIC